MRKRVEATRAAKYALSQMTPETYANLEKVRLDLWYRRGEMTPPLPPLYRLQTAYARHMDDEVKSLNALARELGF